MNNYHYILEYLPKRYAASMKQEADRRACYSFKDGNMSDQVKSALISKVREITGNDKSWVICFIPASTAWKTRVRYNELANELSSLGYQVKMEAVYNEFDRDAEHIAGKSSNPAASFGFNSDCVNGKKVLLIDDIITRGQTFNSVADKLRTIGATSVTGLFLAKTINPDYHPHSFYPEDYEPDPSEFINDGPDFDPEDYYVPDPSDFMDEPDFDPEDYVPEPCDFEPEYEPDYY